MSIFFVAVIYKMATKGVAFISCTVLVILMLPVMPFVIANRVKDEKPLVAKSLRFLWGTLYVIFAIFLLLSF